MLCLFLVSTLVEAVLCETHAGCSAIELYLTINDTKVKYKVKTSSKHRVGLMRWTAAAKCQSTVIEQICVNHELVAKKFACFISEKSSVPEGTRNGDRAPVSLAWDIYSSPHQLLEMKGCCPVKAPPLDILHRKERKDDLHPLTGQVWGYFFFYCF